MFRISSALVAATLIAGVANADRVNEFTVDLAYDKTLLTSEAGAAEVLESLEEQAETACTVRRYGITLVDRVCVDDLVEKAVAEIANDTLSETFAGTITTL